MGEIREIHGPGPETAALELLGRIAEQIASEDLRPDGVCAVMFTDEGDVVTDHSEGLGEEQLVSLFAIGLAKALVPYILEALDD